MTVIWSLILMLLPMIYGMGIQAVMYGKHRQEKGFSLGELFIIGILLEIGLAEVVHTAGLFLPLSISQCTRYLSVLWLGTGVICLLISAVAYGKGEVKTILRPAVRKSVSILDHAAFYILCLLILLQAIILLTGDLAYPKDTMMGETVQTFLASDRIWQVNPLTGQEYELGVPLRLRLLTLPTLYSVLARLTGLEVSALLGRWIPIFVLILAYMAYQSLGNVLFGRGTKGCRIFLLLTGLIFWLGTYLDVMDGFGLRYGGFLASTIRNTVLLPFTLSMALQKKWRPVCLCILAEACMMWTLYGMGICLVAAILLALIVGLRLGARHGKEAA